MLDAWTLSVVGRSVLESKHENETQTEDGHRRRCVLRDAPAVQHKTLTDGTTGAGAGGVATAARLAKAGFKVTVLEKNDFTGGRCSLLHHEGWVCIRCSPDPICVCT
jgi:hypothetical protein